MLTLTELAAIAERHRDDLNRPVREFDIGGRRFPFNTRPAIMGVINLSPDSWYRESVALGADAAIRRGCVLAAQGADLIDLGAESTLPNAARCDAAAQNRMLVPVVRALRERGILVSIETFLPEVARACLEAGANVLNLTGLDRGGEILRMAAGHEAAVILCHVEGEHVRAVGDYPMECDPISRIRDRMAQRTAEAERAGVRRLFMDPGLGFYYGNLQDSAGRVRHQMRMFLNTFRLGTLGWPVCHALPHAFECFREEVRSAEPFFCVLAALGGTHLFRTHEVPRIRAVLEAVQLF